MAKKQLILDKQNKLSSKRVAGIGCIISGGILCYTGALAALFNPENIPGAEVCVRAGLELLLAGVGLLGVTTFERPTKFYQNETTGTYG